MSTLIRIRHQLPGRTRLYLKNEWKPGTIESIVRSYPGVFSATYSTETKSILIHHPCAIHARQLVRYIHHFSPLFTVQQQQQQRDLKYVFVLIYIYIYIYIYMCNFQNHIS